MQTKSILLKYLFISFLTLFIPNLATSQNSVPQIQLLDVSINEVERKIHIDFSLSDAENNVCQIFLSGSSDGGNNFSEITNNVSGAVGSGIMPNAALNLTWEYPENTAIFDYQLRLTANDGIIPGIAEIINGIDSLSLRETLVQIEGERHYLSNPDQLNRVRDTIEARFEQYNLVTNRQSFNYSSVVGENIIGRKAGIIQTDKTYIIDGHYDGVISSPAADDNGSAIAGMLEAARILKDYQFKNTISFIGFDFEESGLIGSQRYVQQIIPSNEDVAGVINFEMIGYYSGEPNSQQIPQGFGILFPSQIQSINADENRGNFIISCGNEFSAPLVTAFESAAELFVPELRVISLVVPGNGQITPDLRRSDHASFWDAGKQALMITDGANFRNPHYHTPGDSASTLNFSFMSHVVKASVAAIILLAEPVHAGYITIDLAPLSNKTHHHSIKPEIHIYPNPSSGSINLTIKSPHSMILQTRIFSLKGDVVWKGNLKVDSFEKQSINLEGVPSGNYIFLAESGEFVFRQEVQIIR